jgi:predicted DNA-binding protein (MmcQ/YjbR family)
VSGTAGKDGQPLISPRPEIAVSLRGRALKKLRAFCLALPEANEVETWGNPTFRAGKAAFAVLDEYGGALCLAARVGLDRQEELLADPRYFETPYAARHGWVSLRLDAQTDWDEVKNLAVEGYRRAALKRMLKALDAR